MGTEAGNAVAAVFHLPDDRPAVAARLVARPSEAIDSTDRETWIVRTTGDDGTLSLRLPAGAWTVEVRSDSLGWRTDIQSLRDTTLHGTLGALRTLVGSLLGLPEDSRVYLPGLARATRLAADFTFRFDSLPPGSKTVVLSEGRRWVLTDPLPSHPILIAAGNGQILYDGMPLRLPGRLVPSRHRLRDSLLSGTTRVFLDPAGARIASSAGPSRDGFRLVWTAAMPRGASVLAPSDIGGGSPFQDVPGLRLAWIPELGSGNLASGSSSGVSLDAAAGLDSSATEGRYRTSPLAGLIGSFDSGILPDTGDFAMVFRARSTAPEVGSLWLLDWGKPGTDSGIRLGIGAKKLSARLGATDTSVALADPSAWAWYALVRKGQTLSCHADGRRLLEWSIESGLDRRTWTRRNLGRGGGIALASLLVWDRAIDGNDATQPATDP